MNSGEANSIDDFGWIDWRSCFVDLVDRCRFVASLAIASCVSRSSRHASSLATLGLSCPAISWFWTQTGSESSEILWETNDLLFPSLSARRLIPPQPVLST